MDVTGFGTAVMLAVAAALWFLYLMPTWFRRREYLATERNATRLQRTIRIMAEAAEVPEEVRLEATAREAAQRERMLRQLERRREALERAQVKAVARPEPATDSLQRLRMRRSRRLASLLVVTGLVAGGVQAWLIAQTGPVVGSWLVLGASAASVWAGSRIQKKLNERALLLRVAAAPVRSRTAWQEPVIDAAPARQWTPVPVPKPLYLERGEAPRVSASNVDAAALMRAAAAEAERALRAAHAEPEVVPFRANTRAEERSEGSRAITRAEERSEGSRREVRNRYANMGIVDASATSTIDLDEALRRRTAAG